MLEEEELYDILEVLNDAEHLVYNLYSHEIMATYYYTSNVTSWNISPKLEAIVQGLRARKVGTLRISNPRLLEKRLFKLLSPAERRRWLNRPHSTRTELEAYRARHSPPLKPAA